MSNPVPRMYASRWAPLAAFVLIVVVGAVGFFALQREIDARTEAGCRSALDTRQVVIDMLDRSGDRSAALDPDDYSGELAEVIRRSRESAEAFRTEQVAEMQVVPPVCNTVPPEVLHEYPDVVTGSATPDG